MVMMLFHPWTTALKNCLHHLQHLISPALVCRHCLGAVLPVAWDLSAPPIRMPWSNPLRWPGSSSRMKTINISFCFFSEIEGTFINPTSTTSHLRVSSNCIFVEKLRFPWNWIFFLSLMSFSPTASSQHRSRRTLTTTGGRQSQSTRRSRSSETLRETFHCRSHLMTAQICTSSREISRSWCPQETQRSAGQTLLSHLLWVKTFRRSLFVFWTVVCLSTFTFTFTVCLLDSWLLEYFHFHFHCLSSGHLSAFHLLGVNWPWSGAKPPLPAKEWNAFSAPQKSSTCSRDPALHLRLPQVKQKQAREKHIVYAACQVTGWLFTSHQQRIFYCFLTERWKCG